MSNEGRIDVRIRAVPLQPHAFFFGGFDIQMCRTLEVMREFGLDAKPLDFWNRDDPFDILHIWGLHSTHENLVRAAKKNNKSVVITPLLPDLTLRGWCGHAVRTLQGRRWPLWNILRHTDRLLVVNDLQVESAVKMFRYPRNQVEIIPTIVDSEFFSDGTEEPVDDLRNYIVCAGNIWPRKNQVRLAQAAIQADIPMVFVGNVMGGEAAYTAEFEALVRTCPSLRWHKWVSLPDLRRIFRNANGVALPSFMETQPASGLEAGALRKPLLLGRRPYARQSFFQNAYLADPTSLDDIARGLRRLRDTPEAHIPRQDMVQQCRPEIVGRNLKRIFSSL
jgi:glycosyltransferase involved in cell wall biosynthesis